MLGDWYHHMKITKWKAEVSLFALFAAGSVAMFLAAMRLPKAYNPSDPGSALFPELIATGLLMISAVICIQCFRARSVQEQVEITRPMKVALLLVTTLIYVASMNATGYLLSTGLWAAVSAVALGFRRIWPVLLIVGFFLLLGKYLFEGILGVPLP